MKWPPRLSQVGLFVAVWGQRQRILTSRQLWLSLFPAAALAALSSDKQVADSLGSATMAELGIAATLFGVVLAGLAVLVIFLSEDYISLFTALPDPEARYDRIVFPFWFTSALAVISILWDLATVFTSDFADATARRALLGGSTWFFLWMLFETLGIAGQISGHGSNRARQILARRPRTGASSQPTTGAGPPDSGTTP